MPRMDISGLGPNLLNLANLIDLMGQRKREQEYWDWKMKEPIREAAKLAEKRKRISQAAEAYKMPESEAILLQEKMLQPPPVRKFFSQGGMVLPWEYGKGFGERKQIGPMTAMPGQAIQMPGEKEWTIPVPREGKLYSTEQGYLPMPEAKGKMPYLKPETSDKRLYPTQEGYLTREEAMGKMPARASEEADIHASRVLAQAKSHIEPLVNRWKQIQDEYAPSKKKRMEAEFKANLRDALESIDDEEVRQQAIDLVDRYWPGWRLSEASSQEDPLGIGKYKK